MFLLYSQSARSVCSSLYLMSEANTEGVFGLCLPKGWCQRRATALALSSPVIQAACSHSLQEWWYYCTEIHSPVGISGHTNQNPSWVDGHGNPPQLWYTRGKKLTHRQNEWIYQNSKKGSQGNLQLPSLLGLEQSTIFFPRLRKQLSSLSLLNLL